LGSNDEVGYTTSVVFIETSNVNIKTWNIWRAQITV
jgi:hypothetical protein